MFSSQITQQKGHSISICWITFHFKEFQSAAIGKKIKIKIEHGPKTYQLFILPLKSVSDVISGTYCDLMSNN